MVGHGHKIQTSSNVCPVFVQSLSMYRLHTISVLARSKLCQFSANFQWGWTDTGPKYAEFVQVLSKKKGILKRKPYWTNSGHRLDLRKVRSGFSFWVFRKEQIGVDRDWEIGQPLDLDRPWTNLGLQVHCFKTHNWKNLQWTNIVQTLDLDRPWTM